MKKAFTIVEMLVVIGIMGILVGTVISAFHANEEKKRKGNPYGEFSVDRQERPVSCPKGARVVIREVYTAHIDTAKFPSFPREMTVYDARVKGPNWISFKTEDGIEVETALDNVVITSKSGER